MTRADAPAAKDAATVSATGAAAAGTARCYGFGDAVRMEWIKLRSLRSVWWTAGITAAGAVAIAVVTGHNTKNAAADLTNNVLAGVALGLLTVGVLGVLAMTGEYSSGTIRCTLAAIPSRPLVLAAKATVFGLFALATGEAAAFLAFFTGRAALSPALPAPGLGQPGVARAVVLAGIGVCLIGLLGLGIGAIVRHTGVAVGVLVGIVFVGAQLLGAAATALIGYVPIGIVGNSLAVVRPLPEALSPWAGLGMLVLYAAVALAAGGLLLVRRDA
jgi:ABC-2 type transport system permease protein